MVVAFGSENVSVDGKYGNQRSSLAHTKAGRHYPLEKEWVFGVMAT